MRKTILTFALALTSLCASAADWTLSPYDRNAPIGWATVDGKVTGSADKNAVVVTTADELIKALKGTDAKTIYVSDTLKFEKSMGVSEAENKTVYGLPGSVLLNSYEGNDKKKTGILSFSKCKNIILRNLTFKSGGAYDIDGSDNLTISGCSYMWIDHCDFQDGVDGNFDCNNGSDNICVSWCRFRYFKEPKREGYTGDSSDGEHRNSNLWGGSDKNASKDEGKLKTTFVCCWWDEGCVERMPRVRFGKVHVLNCLYSSSVTNYCIGAGYRANLYIEGCVFASDAAKQTPWAVYATKNGYKDYNVTLTDCLGAANVQQRNGTIDYFYPADSYSYSALKAANVSKIVSDKTYGAGATLHIESGDRLTTEYVYREPANPTSVKQSKAEATPFKTTYVSLSGVESSLPHRGINIVRKYYADGTVLSKRIVMK